MNSPDFRDWTLSWLSGDQFAAPKNPCTEKVGVVANPASSNTPDPCTDDDALLDGELGAVHEVLLGVGLDTRADVVLRARDRLAKLRAERDGALACAEMTVTDAQKAVATLQAELAEAQSLKWFAAMRDLAQDLGCAYLSEVRGAVAVLLPRKSNPDGHAVRIPIATDPTLPPGTIELRQDGVTVARIVDLAADDKEGT